MVMKSRRILYLPRSKYRIKSKWEKKIIYILKRQRNLKKQFTNKKFKSIKNLHQFLLITIKPVSKLILRNRM